MSFSIFFVNRFMWKYGSKLLVFIYVKYNSIEYMFVDYSDLLNLIEYWWNIRFYCIFLIAAITVLFTSLRLSISSHKNTKLIIEYNSSKCISKYESLLYTYTYKSLWTINSYTPNIYNLSKLIWIFYFDISSIKSPNKNKIDKNPNFISKARFQHDTNAYLNTAINRDTHPQEPQNHLTQQEILPKRALSTRHHSPLLIWKWWVGRSNASSSSPSPSLPARLHPLSHGRGRRRQSWKIQGISQDKWPLIGWIHLLNPRIPIS